MTTAVRYKRITPGHIYGIKTYKFRKFGVGATAWMAFEDWMPDVIGRHCSINDLDDHEAQLLISAMKRLNDVTAEGQETLF